MYKLNVNPEIIVETEFEFTSAEIDNVICKRVISTTTFFCPSLQLSHQIRYVGDYNDMEEWCNNIDYTGCEYSSRLVNMMKEIGRDPLREAFPAPDPRGEGIPSNESSRVYRYYYIDWTSTEETFKEMYIHVYISDKDEEKIWTCNLPCVKGYRASTKNELTKKIKEELNNISHPSCVDPSIYMDINLAEKGLHAACVKISKIDGWTVPGNVEISVKKNVVTIKDMASNDMYCLPDEIIIACVMHGSWLPALIDAAETEEKHSIAASLPAFPKTPNHVWVTTEDSVLSGNCDSGTWEMVKEIKKILKTDNEIGAVRADFLLEISDDPQTRRAVRMSNHRHAICGTPVEV